MSKYGKVLKGLNFVGPAVTAVEEGAYVYTTSSDKQPLALGAAVTNFAGDTVSVAGGMALGAKGGLLLAPFFGGLSIPIGAAIGGFAAHMGYDSKVKPFVREGWTGVSEANRLQGKK